MKCTDNPGLKLKTRNEALYLYPGLRTRRVSQFVVLPFRELFDNRRIGPSTSKGVEARIHPSAYSQQKAMLRTKALDT